MFHIIVAGTEHVYFSFAFLHSLEWNSDQFFLLVDNKKKWPKLNVQIELCTWGKKVKRKKLHSTLFNQLHILAAMLAKEHKTSTWKHKQKNSIIFLLLFIWHSFFTSRFFFCLLANYKYNVTFIYVFISAMHNAWPLSEYTHLYIEVIFVTSLLGRCSVLCVCVCWPKNTDICYF